MRNGKQGLVIVFGLLLLYFNNANENGLNTMYYSRVINDIKPLIPKKEKSDLIKYSDNKLVLFIDKECSNNNYINNNKNHLKLFEHLLDRYDNCFYMINNGFDNNDDIYYTDNDWFIFVKLNDNSTTKCLHNNIINYRHYCISKFRYSKIYTIDGNQERTCSKNTNTHKYVLRFNFVINLYVYIKIY